MTMMAVNRERLQWIADMLRAVSADVNHRSGKLRDMGYGELADKLHQSSTSISEVQHAIERELRSATPPAQSVVPNADDGDE